VIGCFTNHQEITRSALIWSSKRRSRLSHADIEVAKSSHVSDDKEKNLYPFLYAPYSFTPLNQSWPKGEDYAT
jgi:hypothetical protein